MSDLPPVIESRTDVQPRLGIIHLMTWTLGSAIILGLARAIDPPAEEIPFGMPGLVIALRAIYAFISGAALGGLLLWLRRMLIGGPRFPIAPGHWLLLIVGTTSVVSWTAFGLMFAYDRWSGIAVRQDFRFWLGLNASLNTITLLLLLVAIWHCSRWRTWQAALSLMALGKLLQAALCALALAASLSTSGSMAFWAFRLLQWIDLYCGVVLLVALTFDWTQRQRYDWLHYTGVGVWLALVALTWSWQLVAWLAS